jgi:hypothetical protein
MTSLETDTQDYADAVPSERLERLLMEYHNAKDDRHKAIVEGRIMELTVTMDEHPEGNNNVCLCADCRTCG